MKRAFGRASVVLAVACGATGAAAHACREPTQVTVEIRTLGFRCSELKKVTVVVASEPDAAERKATFPQAEVSRCESEDEVGTLVVTPAGDRGAVMVLASYTDERCEPPDYRGCIVARRQFSFIDHVPLRLPITLEASCKDVPCNALSSCRSGQCVSSNADCSTDGTCSAPAEPVSLADGAVVPPPPDATVDAGADASSDAGFDAPSDGTTTSDGAPLGDGGNACPSSAATPDCNDMSLVCCAHGMYFGCTTPGGDCADGPWFQCTGRKHCNGAYCCAAPSMPVSGQTSACVSEGMCTAGGVFLCNSDADCPANKTCTGTPYASRMNGIMKRCAP